MVRLSNTTVLKSHQAGGYGGDSVFYFAVQEESSLYAESVTPGHSVSRLVCPAFEGLSLTEPLVS